MSKQKHYTKQELVMLGRHQKQALDAAAGSVKLITLVILHERHGFDADALNRFVEDFEDVLAFYNNSNDYKALLKEWNDYFADYAGITILPERGKTT